MKKARIFDSAYEAEYYRKTQQTVHESMDLYDWNAHVVRMQRSLGCICIELGILSILSVMNGLYTGNSIYMIILGIVCITVGVVTYGKKEKDELLESLLLATYDGTSEDD